MHHINLHFTYLHSYLLIYFLDSHFIDFLINSIFPLVSYFGIREELI